MEMGFDQNSWRIQPGPQAGESVDWHALRARLGAAYAARNALATREGSGDSARSGSFDVDSARSVASFGQALAGVNPTVLGNGNRESGKDAGAAGPDADGGRG